MKTAKEIVDALGHEEIADALCVSRRMINAHVQREALPSSWFDALEKMAGQPLPREVFTFKKQKNDA